MRTFSDFIHGKTVSIIGGAPQFDESAFDADVVIRINEHAIAQGGRADVVYSSLATDPQAFFKAGVMKSLRWFMADRRGRYFTESFLSQLQAHRVQSFTYQTVISKSEGESGSLVDEAWLQRAMNQYGCKPFTGLVALLHALALPCRSVYLTGFTFYAEDGTVPVFRHSHMIEPNREIVADLLKWDTRLKVDDACAAALHYPILPATVEAPAEGTEANEG